MKSKMTAFLPFEEEIPDELAKLIGLIVIRCGQLERVLMNVYHRTLEPDSNLLDVIAKLRQDQKPLGGRISQLEAEFNKRNFPVPSWLDFTSLKELAEKRNAIHDALITDENGAFGWLSGSHKRSHRSVDLPSLQDFLKRLRAMLSQLTVDAISQKP